MSDKHDWLSKLGIDVSQFGQVASSDEAGGASVTDSETDPPSTQAAAAPVSNPGDSAEQSGSGASDDASHDPSQFDPSVGAYSSDAQTGDGQQPDPAAAGPGASSDEVDDPNVIYAGQNFQMKMLDGFTVGEGLGLSTFRFAIWDMDNSRRAIYNFYGVIGTLGAPVSDSGEGDWSETFHTSSPMQVDQFSGVAHVTEVSVGLVGAWQIALASAGLMVRVPTFFNKSFGFDGGPGTFSVVNGSVTVFKG